MRLTQLSSVLIATFSVPIGWAAILNATASQHLPPPVAPGQSAVQVTIMAAFTPVPNEPPSGTRGSGTR